MHQAATQGCVGFTGCPQEPHTVHAQLCTHASLPHTCTQANATAFTTGTAAHEFNSSCHPRQACPLYPCKPSHNYTLVIYLHILVS